MCAEITKVCKECGEEKPLAEYRWHKRAKGGRRPRCKKCESDKEKARAARKKAIGLTAEEQVCSACKLIKPAAEFSKDWTNASGLRKECKLCDSLRTRMAKYSLTKEQVLELLAVPACQCCGFVFENDAQKHFDHCHTHSHVRGVVCNDCNMVARRGAQEAVWRCQKVIAYIERDLEWQACEPLTDNSLPTSPLNIAPAPSVGGRRATAEDEWRFTTLSVGRAASMTGAISSRSAPTAMPSYTPVQLSLDFRT